MIEVKIEVSCINDNDSKWEINLYSDGKFIKKICTCYEEDYAIIVAIAISEKIGAVLTK